MPVCLQQLATVSGLTAFQAPCEEANGFLEVDVWLHVILQLVAEMLYLKPPLPRLQCLDGASIQRLQMTHGFGRQVVQANAVELYIWEMAGHIV